MSPVVVYLICVLPFFSLTKHLVSASPFDRQFTDIRFLSGFSDNQIVAQLLPGAKKFPAYDRFAVSRGTDSITCDFFLKGCASSTFESGRAMI
jgi:hypothetical protein